MTIIAIESPCDEMCMKRLYSYPFRPLAFAMSFNHIGTISHTVKADVSLFDDWHDAHRVRPIARHGGPELHIPSPCHLADLLGTPPPPRGRDLTRARPQDTAGENFTRHDMLCAVCHAGVGPAVPPRERPALPAVRRMFVWPTTRRRMFVGGTNIPSSTLRGVAVADKQTAQAVLHGGLEVWELQGSLRGSQCAPPHHSGQAREPYPAAQSSTEPNTHSHSKKTTHRIQHTTGKRMRFRQ